MLTTSKTTEKSKSYQKVEAKLSVVNLDGSAFSEVATRKLDKNGSLQQAPQAIDIEDEFRKWYSQPGDASVQIIAPTYELKKLEVLCQQNNALGPCIDAMVTNVAGTGFMIEPMKDSEGEEKQAKPKTPGKSNPFNSKKKADASDDPKKAEIEGFFQEPWPGESWLSLMKQVRRDVESIGVGFLEFLRSLDGKIAFARYVPGKTVRYVVLSEPIMTEVTMFRGGKEVKYTVAMRHRRFAQVIQGVPIYFKEFGCKLPLDKKSGKFQKPAVATASLEAQANVASEGTLPIPPENLATELMAFTALPDVDTPYGVPRWISQLPSVLGSRKAEELNLSFFDAGGIPPMMILVQGGELVKETKADLLQQLHGGKKTMHKIAIAEIAATGGDINSPGNVRVTVERFGAERQQDSMFEGYDDKCETRIRSSFRLPPIFAGKAEDYSFASAFASYTVAEAQVFKPERDEIDEMINLRLMPELDPEREYQYRSLPLAVKDVTNQLTALQLLTGQQAITNDELVKTVNEITALEVTVSELNAENTGAPLAPQFNEDGLNVMDNLKVPGSVKPTPKSPPKDAVPGKPNAPKKKALVGFTKSAVQLEAISEEIASMLEDGPLGQTGVIKIATLFAGLSPADISMVKGMVAAKSLVGVSEDNTALASITGCGLALLTSRANQNAAPA